MSPRQSSEAGDPQSEFPGLHFPKDLFVLTLGSSQADLLGEGWLDVTVRVSWLKARFLALQVNRLAIGGLFYTGLIPG